MTQFHIDRYPENTAWDQKHRIGVVEIDRIFIDTEPEVIRVVLNGTIPLAVEQSHSRPSLKYTLLHPSFEEVLAGVSPPQYVAVITRTDTEDGVQYAREFKKVSG